MNELKCVQTLISSVEMKSEPSEAQSATVATEKQVLQEEAQTMPFFPPAVLS